MNKLLSSHRIIIILVSILNILLLLLVFFFYSKYNSAYQDGLTQENLSNIKNLNNAASANATSLFSTWNTKLSDIKKYVEMNELNYEETLSFISDNNSVETRYFELIGSDYKGFIARTEDDGSYEELDYSHDSYQELQKAFDDTEDKLFDDICFAPEFTGAGKSASKFFAIYKHINIKNENNENEVYTLLLATKTSIVVDMVNSLNDFEDQTTALIDDEGNYIVSGDLKNTNFYDYIAEYNNLSLDQKNKLMSDMKQNKEGVLYYKAGGMMNEDCVFIYLQIEDSNWNCVTCVPISSFREPNFNDKYMVFSIVVLLILFIIDVLWLRDMNRRLKKSMVEAQSASVAKGEFMSRMSHEIRTPLNAIIGYNNMAKQNLEEAKTKDDRALADIKVKDYLHKSAVASGHLLTIINDVLDMSAISSGRIKVAHEKFDFKALIASLTTVFYSQAKSKGVDMEVILCSAVDEWFVGDQMRTNQILTNLLSNAIKFTQRGGSVKLTVTQFDYGDDLIHIRFDVVDTGIGMTQEYLDHIWTPFEQADSSISRRFGGTGLGLSITKNLVDLMEGKISVSSEVDVGSIFTVELIYEKAEAKDSNKIYHFDKINALIVDADTNTCEYIKSIFDNFGARCTSVNSSKKALKAVTDSIENNDRFNVCIVDYLLPKTDGITTINLIKEIKDSGIRSYALSGYDYSEIAEKAHEAGIENFVTKPLFQSSLFDMFTSLGNKNERKYSEKKQKYVFKDTHILLAEDNAMNMEIAKSILECAGIVLEHAWDGKEAFEIFEKSKPGTFDAVLMDIRMPIMDGHEATKAIRNSKHPEAKDIPIIAMTADAFDEDVSQSLASGMNAHITKPINVEELFTTLKELIDK